MTPVKQSQELELISFRATPVLRAAIDRKCDDEGTTTTEVIRTALDEYLLGGSGRRITAPAGYLPQFDAFVADLEKRPRGAAVLIVAERGGERFIFEGAFDAEETGVSHIAIKHRNNVYLVPRSEVVIFDSGNVGRLNRLAMHLKKMGYTPFTGAP